MVLQNSNNERVISSEAIRLLNNVFHEGFLNSQVDLAPVHLVAAFISRYLSFEELYGIIAKLFEDVLKFDIFVELYLFWFASDWNLFDGMIGSIVKFEITLVANDLENIKVDRILHFAGILSKSCKFDPRKIKDDLFLFFRQKFVIIYDQRRINERIRSLIFFVILFFDSLVFDSIQIVDILLLLNRPSSDNIWTQNQLLNGLFHCFLSNILSSEKLDNFGLE